MNVAEHPTGYFAYPALTISPPRDLPFRRSTVRIHSEMMEVRALTWCMKNAMVRCAVGLRSQQIKTARHDPLNPLTHCQQSFLPDSACRLFS